MIYNADRSQGPARLLFAVNPTPGDVTVPLDSDSTAGRWQQLADAERFHGLTGRGSDQPVEGDLFIPGLGCGLWLDDG